MQANKSRQSRSTFAGRRRPTGKTIQTSVDDRLRSYAAVLLGAALTILAVSPATADSVYMVGAFEPRSLDTWKHKSFEGKTQYRLVGQGDTRVLQATCHGTASAIAKRVSVDLSRTPILRWEWRVDHIYAGLDGTTKAGDDYAARIYVIHDGGWFFWQTRAINYVWANSQPRGTHWPSPFTDKAMMVAVQSGPPADPGTWVQESRNVRKDFKRFYGLGLETIDAVAIMTDCDNSGRSGRAYYRNIRFTAKPPDHSVQGALQVRPRHYATVAR